MSTLRKDIRVVRKLQFPNNFLIKITKYRALVRYFASLVRRTKGTPNKAVVTVPLSALAALSLCLFSACPFGAPINVVKIPEPEPVPVTGVSILNKARRTVTAGTTETLFALVTPDNAANKAVTWSSSNSSIASVDNGIVTASAIGTTIITVTTVDGGYTDECEFAVHSSALTPIAAGDHTERVTVFTVSIGGFANDADANNASLIITPVNGLSFSGHDAPGNASDGVKTFTVFVTYDGVQAFIEGAAHIVITGITNTPSTFTYSGGAITKSVRIIDGQAADRAIPVNQTNITAFNSYANTAGGLARHYQLAENAALKTPEPDGSNWTPIGAYSIDNPQIFTGSFDGQGHTIANLTINASAEGTEGTGMFGFTGENSVIKNLGLAGGSVRSNGDKTGGVAGWNKGGTVQNCYVTGSVTGSDYTGGVAGYTSDGGIVQNCYVTGSVTGNDYAGGVTGTIINGGMVQNCYTLGRITGNNRTGGVAGYIDSGGTVQYCYAAGRIAGSVSPNTDPVIGNCIGGVAGYNNGGRIQNCAGLNPLIRIGPTTTSTTSIGRVVGYQSGGTISNNYGRQPMPGVTAANSANGKDGASISDGDWNSADWWEKTAKFPSGAWEFRAGLPALKDMPEGAQNPTVVTGEF